MFSRGFSGDCPRTYSACESYWNDATERKKAKGYLILGYNTNLYKEDGYYRATFHGNTIVRYYPEYRQITAHGWSTSPTTQGRICALTGVSMHSNSRCGFDEHVRINGYPFHEGIRVDNYGRILPADILPDRRRRVRRTVVTAYIQLWKAIAKQIEARYEMGEFHSTAIYSRRTREAAFAKVCIQLEAGVWLDTEAVTQLLNTAMHPKDSFKGAIARARGEMRDGYYYANDGYYTEEIANG